MIARGSGARPLAVALLALCLSAPVRADVKIGGLVDLVGSNTEDDVTNVTFRDTSNFDMVRTRIFLDAAVSDRVDAFGQILASGFNDLFIYGAYLRFREVGPMDLQVGLIPSTIGNWGARTYSDRNPLVGVPLMHNHHTSLNPWAPQTLDDLLAARDDRSNAGLPMMYDNCWNVGAEAFGQLGALDWSLGMLAGSVTLPLRDQVKDLPQGTARLSWFATPGFSIGANGWLGTYLFDGQGSVAGYDPNEYLNGGVGVDLYFALRFVEFHSEVYRSLWEHPTLPDLYASSGYLDAKYRVLPSWYLAARGELFVPDRVNVPGGGTEHWDYPVRRLEWGVGYKPANRVTIKAVTQHNRFDGSAALDSDHYLLQISAGF